MNILALDLSIACTGLCLPDGSLSVFVPEEEGEWRMDEIAAHVRDRAVECRADLVVMEDVFIGQHASSSKPLCMLHGAVRLQLMRKHILYVVVSPMTLKRFATGSHQAKKPDMRMAWYKRTGADVADDNMVDAAFLHAAACQWYGKPKFPMPKDHVECLGKVTWPLFDQKQIRQLVEQVADSLALPPKVAQTPLDVAERISDQFNEEGPQERIK